MQRLGQTLLATLVVAALGGVGSGCIFPWMLDDEEPAADPAEDYEPVAPDYCASLGYWPGDFYYDDWDDLAPLEGCTYVQGDLRIEQTSLKSLGGLDDLITIGGSLIIDDNDLLDDLSGLERLVQIEGGLRLFDNGRLPDLQGLDSLIEVGDDLEIAANSHLDSLVGLDDLRFVDGDLITIRFNPLLPTCEAEELVAHLEANGFEGAVQITGNNDEETCE